VTADSYLSQTERCYKQCKCAKRGSHLALGTVFVWWRDFVRILAPYEISSWTKYRLTNRSPTKVSRYFFTKSLRVDINNRLHKNKPSTLLTKIRHPGRVRSSIQSAPQNLGVLYCLYPPHFTCLGDTLYTVWSGGTQASENPAGFAILITYTKVTYVDLELSNKSELN
jgi:hypothetical protein